MSRNYKTPEAATKLGLSKSFLNKARPAGKGPAFQRYGRAVIYTEEALEAYEQANRVEPVANRHHDSDKTQP